MDKINYIPAFYYGNRMNTAYSKELQKNKFFMVDQQIEALNKYGDGISLVTFVFNLDHLNDEHNILKEFATRKINFDYEIHCRLNTGASYGAWDEVIKKNLNNFDYFFITEDDFIPATSNFYTPFKMRCKDPTAYVCMFANQARPHLGVPHAAIPHGIVKADAARKVFKNQNQIFKIYLQDNSYNTFYQTQMEFFEYFIREGYVISDILDEFSAPYMNSPTRTIITYGNPSNPVLVEPVPIP